VVLQLALDAPDLVHTVAVLEPFIASVIMGGSPRFGGMMAMAGSMYATGDRAGAVELFARAVAGDGFRETFGRCRRVTSSGGSKRPTRCSKTTALA
jgi:hypothetical protein